MDYAGFWRRFLALAIDGVIGGFIGLVLGAFFFNPIPIGLVVSMLYQPIFEASVLQATPGKAMLGMRVTDLMGARITLKAAIIRYLAKFLSGFFLMIGYLIQPFTSKGQALHDLLAETLVVRGEVKNVNYFRVWYDQVLETLGMVDRVPAKTESQNPSSAGPGTAQPSDLVSLYELYQKGILSEAEYSEKREQLLKRL